MYPEKKKKSGKKYKPIFQRELNILKQIWGNEILSWIKNFLIKYKNEKKSWFKLGKMCQ